MPDPTDPFNEPEWVTKQCIEWLARKKRKEKFRQDTLDVAKAEAIQRRVTRERCIENGRKKKAKHAKAVQAVCEERENEGRYRKCDESTLTSASSSVASSTSRKKRSSTSTKSHSSKRFPKVSQANMLDQYLTPSTKTSSQSVPSTVSTVASSQRSVTSSQLSSSQMTDLMSPPPARPSGLSSVKKELSVMDPPLPVNTRFINDNPNVPNSHKLPHGALLNPYEIRAAVTPGICYGCKVIFSECAKKKYRDLCLHAVKNLIDEYGYEGVTDFVIRKAYHT